MKALAPPQTVSHGLTVCPIPFLGTGGGTIYAEVEPSIGAGLRPSNRRWWFEVHRIDDEGERWTHAYERGGSGGAYTLRACVRKAQQAVEHASIGTPDTMA